jgi:cystathionine beta-synthase
MSSAAFRRPFSAEAAAVFKRAREMKDTPYDPAKEGDVSVPNYVGWDAELESDFQKLQTGPKTAGRNYKDICESALDLIGFTPMVRMSRLKKHLDVECELLGKCEFFNAGGSVKDRIGKRMVEEAEKSGRIKPGDILIEPTSGNTGIGLCMTAAIKGYKMIIALPQKMSGEKVNTMKALGAEILRTPTEAAWDAKDSHLFLSQRLAKDLNGHVLDQYKHPGNPLAHYEGTAEEIFEQTGGKLDYMVMSTGTGGTCTGTAKKLKEKIPGIKIVGVDPYGSILAKPDSVNDGSSRTGHKRLQAYHVEGIGYDFVPTVLDQDVIDYWIKTDDDESFAMGRNIVRHEGLLIGGSCGATMAGAYKFIRENNIGAGKRVGILFADSSRNYMSKFMDDDWCANNGFDMDAIKKTTQEKGFFQKLFGL